MLIIAILILAITSLWLPRHVLLQKYWGLIACLLLGCLIGLRSFDSGTDTLTYVKYFESVTNNPSSLEPGFYLYTLAFNLFDSQTAYIFSLSVLPLLFVYLAAVRFDVSRPALVVCLFISFVPGIDLITNGLRQGLALSLALWLAAVSAGRPTLRAMWFTIPTMIHFSSLMVLIADLIAQRLSSKQINFLMIIAWVLIIFWQFVSAELLVNLLRGLLGSPIPIFETLLRYLVNTNSILSPTVYLYFLFVSVAFAFISAFLFRRLDRQQRLTLASLFNVSVLLFFGFALVSFSGFAYRFMFIAYVFQVVVLGVLLDWRGEQATTKLMYMSLISLGSLVTYTTNTMVNATFLDVL